MCVHIYWTQSRDDIEINLYLCLSFLQVFCTVLFGSASIIGTAAYKLKKTDSIITQFNVVRKNNAILMENPIILRTIF